MSPDIPRCRRASIQGTSSIVFHPTHYLVLISALLCLSSSLQSNDSHSTVSFSPDTYLNIGGISNLQRDRYFLIHGSPDELPPEQLALLREKTSAPFARSVNIVSHELRKIPADPHRPGYKLDSALDDTINQLILEHNIENNTEWKSVGLSLHPHDLISTNPAHWGGDNDEGRAKALIKIIQQLVKHGWTPPFLEPMNEPRDKLELMGVDMDRVIAFHRNVIPKLKESLPNTKIGGFAEFEIRFNDRDFGNWRDFMGRYITNVGDPGDFISFHPYAINPRRHTGGESMAGSVIEASLDLVLAASQKQFDRKIPVLISEYGLAGMAGKASLYHHYSPRRDFEIMKEINGQLFTYLLRPDEVYKAIPFIVPHSEWWRRSAKYTTENPHSPWELFHNLEGTWKHTHLIKFYELWEPIRGRMIFAQSNDINLPTVAFRDQDTIWLCVHNLSDEKKIIELKDNSSTFSDLLSNTSRRALYLQDNIPTLTTDSLKDNFYTMQPHETVIFEVRIDPTLNDSFLEISRDTYYSDTVLKQIDESMINLNITISGELIGTQAATLRLATAGNPTAPLPRLSFNGHSLEVPSQEIGVGSQRPNGDHWGVRRTPIPPHILKDVNQIELTFEEQVGWLTSAALVIERKNNAQ